MFAFALKVRMSSLMSQDLSKWLEFLQLDDVVVIAAVDQVRDVDAEDVHIAGEAQRCRIRQVLRIDQHLLTVVLEEQVELG